MGSGGEKGSGKSNLFGGMKIKGPGADPSKDQKPSAVQSETSLVFSSRQGTQQQYQNPSSPQSKQVFRRTQRRASQFSNDEKAQQEQIKKTIEQEQQIESQRVQRKVSEQTQEGYSSTKKKQSSQKMETDRQSQKDSDVVSQKHYQKSEKPFEKPQRPVQKAKNPFLSQLKKTAPKQEKDKKSDIQKPIQQIKKKEEKKEQKKSQKQTIVEQLNQSHLRQIALIQKQKESKERIIQLASQLAALKDELTIYTSKQFQAVQREEYQQAGQFQETIQQITIKITERQQELKKAQESFHQLQYEELALGKSSWSQNKRLVRKIKLVELQLNQQASSHKREEGEKIQQEKNKNEHQRKKISRLQADINYQKGQLKNFMEKYDDDKNSRINPLLEQKETLKTNKINLETQIQELENKLKQKKVTLRGTQQALKQIESQITEVEDSFKEEGAKLSERQLKLDSMESEREDLESKLKESERLLEESIRVMNNKAQDLNTQAESLSAVAKSIEVKATTIQDLLEDRKVKLDNFIHNSKLLQEFEIKHKGAKEKIKQLQFSKSNILAEVNKFQERKKQLKIQIPVLQAQQKSMATAKNFKAAGMKKTQIKEKLQELQEINKKIQKNFIEQKRIQEAIIQIEAEQEQYIQEQNQIKKNLAISQYRFQGQKLNAINEEKEWLKICKVQNKQKLMALLQSEIESIQEELDYIGDEYGLNKEKSPIKTKPKKEQSQETPQHETSQEKVQEEVQNHTDEKKVELHDEQAAQVDQTHSQQAPSKQTQSVPLQQKIDDKEYQPIQKDEPDGGYVPLQLD